MPKTTSLSLHLYPSISRPHGLPSTLIFRFSPYYSQVWHLAIFKTMTRLFLTVLCCIKLSSCVNFLYLTTLLTILDEIFFIYLKHTKVRIKCENFSDHCCFTSTSAGLYFCFKHLTDANIFIIMYGITSIYFAVSKISMFSKERQFIK